MQEKSLCWQAGKNITAVEEKRSSISGLFFHTFQTSTSPARARLHLCTACGSVVLLRAALIFDYFVVTEIAFMDNQAQITEKSSRSDSEKVS